MTLELMSIEGKKQTAKEISNFYTQIAEEYKAAMVDMRNELKELYLKHLTGIKPEDYYNVVLKQDRLNKVINVVQDLYTEAAKKAGINIIESGKIAITNNFYRQQYALAFANNAINTRLSFAVINKAVIEISVVGTKEVWEKTTEQKRAVIEKSFGPLNRYQPKHGTLIDTLLANRQEDLIKIRRSITQGLIQGKSYRQTAKLVQDVMNSTINNAMRIVRTESNRNLNAGHYALTQNARIEQGIKLKRQILSVIDLRTREQSIQVDTKMEGADGFFRYPGDVPVAFPGNSGVQGWDINDRETVIERLEGFDIKERRGRNPLTGKNEVMSFQDYDSWMSKYNFKKSSSGRYTLGGK